MSKFDDIYLETVYAILPAGIAFVINLEHDAVYQSLKQQIKDLMLELVDINWFIGKDAYDRFLVEVSEL